MPSSVTVYGHAGAARCRSGRRCRSRRARAPVRGGWRQSSSPGCRRHRALIDDVRDRGDAAVCDALARFDGVDVTPDGLRVTDDEIDAATVDADVGCDRRRSPTSARSTSSSIARAGGWEFRVRAGADGGREDHPDHLGRAVHTVGQGELSQRHLSAGGAGDRGRCATHRVGRAARAGGPRRGRPGRARGVPQVGTCENVFRVNGPAGVAALGFGTGRSRRCARSSVPAARRSQAPQVEMQRYGVTTMMLLGPTESLVVADDTADPMRPPPTCSSRPSTAPTLRRACSPPAPSSPAPSRPSSSASSPICPTPRAGRGRASARTAGACSSPTSPRPSTWPTATPPSTCRWPSPTARSTAWSTRSSTPARS